MASTNQSVRDTVNSQLRDSIVPHTLWDGRYFGPMIPATPAQWRASLESRIGAYGPNGWATGAADAAEVKAIVDEGCDMYNKWYYGIVFAGSTDPNGTIPDWQLEARKALSPDKIQLAVK